jgi:divalent metal cation (Fe/Co/Zn/Cd) transporter
VDVPANWSVADAHAKVSELESRIKARLPNIAEIHSHIEPAGK